MPKPFLIHDDATLERECIETMLAGLKQWRPDLHYPESHSDMQACFRGLLSCFEIKRRPLPRPLRITCHYCDGIGKFITKSTETVSASTTCDKCEGRGWLPMEA